MDRWAAPPLAFVTTMRSHRKALARLHCAGFRQTVGADVNRSGRASAPNRHGEIRVPADRIGGRYRPRKMMRNVWMRSHAVLIGYSARGRVVLSALFAGGHATELTVVDSDPERVVQAGADGAHAVAGEGWRLDVLWSAGAHTSDHIVVAVTDDALALRITSVVRSFNETATITTLVRSTQLHELIEFLGADHVLVADRVGEWALKMESLPYDQLPELEWAVEERPVMPYEVGSSPLDCGNDVLAIVRDGQRIWAEDAEVGDLRGDDRLIVLSTMPVSD